MLCVVFRGRRVDARFLFVFPFIVVGGVWVVWLISAGQLHVLRRVHVRSINPVVFRGPSHREGGGELILKRVSRLDAFSGYPFRT